MEELETKNSNISEEKNESLDEEIKLDSDSKMESYFSDSEYKAYFKMIKRFPLLTRSENEKLAIKAQNGDSAAFEKVVNHNLRLVVKFANKYKYLIKHMKIMDIIQEGNIGLMDSINGFNPEKGAFSTYAGHYIEGYIRRAIDNKEAEIRKPVNFERLKRKYNKIIFDCEKNGEDIPSDKELMEKLQVGEDTLKNLKESKKLDPVSMHQKISEKNDEDHELEYFIHSEDASYDKVVEKIDNHNLFTVLKNILSPYDYFIIYYRFLSDIKKSLEEIARIFNITGERVRQKEAKILLKIKPYMDKNDGSYKNILAKIINEKNIESYNTDPIKPENITLFLYLRDQLNEVERKILYLQLFGEYKIEWYLKKLNISKDLYNEINERIKIHINSIYSDIYAYKKFHNNILNNYGSDIYNIKLDEKVDIVDYEGLKNEYENYSYEEIMSLFSYNNIELNTDEIDLLKRYFKIPQKNIGLFKEKIENEIYLVSFGYKEKKKKFPLLKLKKAFAMHKDKFTEEQILYIQCFIIHTKDKNIFLKKYPKSHYHRHSLFLYKKLERLYYNVDDFVSRGFSKEKYEYVKSKFPRKLTDERIKILDLYYGVNCKKHSREEIKQILNIDSELLHHKIDKAIQYLLSLYNNRSGTITLDLEIYKPYIFDEKICLTDDMRTLLKLYIIDRLEYDEIRGKLNLKIPDMSNIITDALRRIDFYRYGITEKENISIDELKDFSKYYSDILTPLQLRVIYLRKIELYDNIETAEMLNITKNEVNNIISRFNRLYKKYKIKDIKVDEKDVLKEIRTHISESVIEDFDKELLSFKYGLKTKFNPDGKKLSNEEIANKYNLSLCVVNKKLYLLIDDIKAKKAGYLKNELLFIERRKLDEILDDPRLPISNKERDIICYLFELKEYPYKNIDEIVKIFNYNVKNNAKIRYKRAILSIYKYLNNEIPPKIDFELDVFPNLKYFSKRDELFLIEYFQNNLSIKDISEKYNLSYDVAYNLINRLNDSILEITNNPNASKFDFEFYRKQKDNPKLPFYGNLELMKSVFDLYFGENNINSLEMSEIVKELNIQNASSTLLNTFKNYLLSFYELKDGIEKIKCFTYEEIIDYYNTHYENISENDLRSFEIYFKRKNSSIINGSNIGISYPITVNLLKEKYPNYFNLETTTKEEFLKIFKKYHKQLLRSIKLYLMAYYGIREREFMNGKDLNHVYRILNKLTYHKVNIKNEMTLSRK